MRPQVDVLLLISTASCNSAVTAGDCGRTRAVLASAVALGQSLNQVIEVRT